MLLRFALRLIIVTVIIVAFMWALVAFLEKTRPLSDLVLFLAGIYVLISVVKLMYEEWKEDRPRREAMRELRKQVWEATKRDAKSILQGKDPTRR